MLADDIKSGVNFRQLPILFVQYIIQYMIIDAIYDIMLYGTCWGRTEAVHRACTQEGTPNVSVISVITAVQHGRWRITRGL
jgi:hypothetical protein